MLRLAEVLFQFEELHYIEVFLEFNDAFVQIEVSFICLASLKGVKRLVVITSEVIPKCITKAILKISPVHDHLIDEVKLLSLWKFANWTIPCISNSIFHCLLVFRRFVVCFNRAMWICQTFL